MRSVLILLPGMDGTGELFSPLLDALDVEIETTVVRYPDRAATYAQHEAVARAELPKHQPFIILGESFSGPVAISIAASAPPNLRGLILCASFVTCPHWTLKLLRPFTPFTPFASPKFVPAFIAQRSLLGRFATPPLRAAQAQALRHVSSPTLTARLRAMADMDVRKELAAISVPALYLRASADGMVSARFGDEFMAHARHGTLIEIEGPHLLLQSNPREAARHIRSFVGAHVPHVPAVP